MTDTNAIPPVLPVLELKRLLTVLSSLFDIARLVNPHDTAILTIEEDGSVTSKPYTCFKVWNRTERCENCTSRDADREHCRRDKYEYVKNSIFYVISNPIAYRDAEGREHPVVLEIVSHVSDHLAGGRFQHRSIIDIIDENQRMLYTDDLTGAFNRRYLFEKIVKQHLTHAFTLVMIDVHRFKEINDTQGHLTGDLVLKTVAARIRDCVREGDYVARYGGDEFVAVLNHCDEANARQIIHRLKKNLCGLQVAGCEKTVSCDIGLAAGDCSGGAEPAFLAALEAADRAMYEEKRRHYVEEGLLPPPR